MKKNVYLAQINYLHGKSTFLPYAAGTLIANAKANSEIDSFYEFKEPLFIRQSIDSFFEKIESPFLFGFSNYIWNHEYNKVLAGRIKEKFPECIILFGGHQISPDTSLMEKEEYIDIMCFGEGEEVFENLLLALKNGVPLYSVANIATEKKAQTTALLPKKLKEQTIRHPILPVFSIQLSGTTPKSTFIQLLKPTEAVPTTVLTATGEIFSVQSDSSPKKRL